MNASSAEAPSVVDSGQSVSEPPTSARQFVEPQNETQPEEPNRTRITHHRRSDFFRETGDEQDRHMQLLQDIRKEQQRNIQLLEDIRNEQQSYIQLRRERWGVSIDYHHMAESLWKSGDNAWVRFDPDNWDEYRKVDFDKSRPVGREFLNSLLPSKSNTERASRIFSRWVRQEQESSKVFSAPWRDAYLSGQDKWDEETDSHKFCWPGRQRDYTERAELRFCCFNKMISATPQVELKDPFDLVYVDDIMEVQYWKASGLLVQITVNDRFNVIDFGTAAGILSLVEGNRSWPEGGPEFLDGHIAEWRQRSVHDRCGLRRFDGEDLHGKPQTVSRESESSMFGWRSRFSSREKLEFKSGVYMHYMRSFVVTAIKEEPAPASGVKCQREYVTFRGFYATKVEVPTKLIEKRFSAALAILPLQEPAGHFAVLSVCDGRGSTVDGSLDHDIHVSARSKPWGRYGILPAGLYTGISVFQIEICAIIDAWEQDWNNTITLIDQKVSLKLIDLENVELLGKLVLNNEEDASVSYFKVIHFLNFFSDTVRDAPGYLESLSKNFRLSDVTEQWFEFSYPHLQDTMQILDRNWDVVKERQHGACSRILAKLERTTNEVKSLQDGLFSVQSITEARHSVAEARRALTEAQKSRALNKYLLVFTIFTILFLPPTFVATIFGMDIFQSDSVRGTQKTFWTVLGVLSGTTYVLAALGLFGSKLSAEERRKWWDNFRQRQGEGTAQNRTPIEV